VRYPPLTEETKRRILEHLAAHGPSVPYAATALGIDSHLLEHCRKNTMRLEWRAAVDSWRLRAQAVRDVAPVDRKRRHIGDVLDLPVRPFAVPVPTAPKFKDAKPLTAVVFGDTHYPFHDPSAVAVVLGIIEDVQPDVVAHLGDLVDCWQISRWDKDPARVDTLQENLDQARTLLHQIAQVAPKARRVLLEGNHEERLTRAVFSMEGAARELARLKVFQQSMTWPVLLGLEAIGWEWVPQRDQSKTRVLPKVITKHGTIVRKWGGYTARGEWEKYGASGVSGHTHRAGVFKHRDANGTATWIECGCTCDLEPSYGTDFDWAQACVVLSWNANRRLMAEELVVIRNGAALWRGREVA